MSKLIETINHVAGYREQQYQEVAHCPFCREWKSVDEFKRGNDGLCDRCIEDRHEEDKGANQRFNASK